MIVRISDDIKERRQKRKKEGKASGEEERSITSCSNSMNHDQSTRRHSTCRTTRLKVSTSFGDKHDTNKEYLLLPAHAITHNQYQTYHKDGIRIDCYLIIDSEVSFKTNNCTHMTL